MNPNTEIQTGGADDLLRVEKLAWEVPKLSTFPAGEANLGGSSLPEAITQS